jgi:hypothetical protein
MKDKKYNSHLTLIIYNARSFIRFISALFRDR